jgi:hypothetical protein
LAAGPAEIVGAPVAHAEVVPDAASWSIRADRARWFGVTATPCSASSPGGVAIVGQLDLGKTFGAL